MNGSTLLAIGLAIHFIHHLISTVVVVYSLHHSNKVHRQARWKLAAAVLWMLFSLYLIIELMSEHRVIGGCT